MASEKTVQKNLFFNFFFQFVVVGAIFFVIGFSFGQKKIQIDRKSFVPRISISGQTPPKDINVDFSLMWDVLDKLPKEFLDKGAIDSQKLLYGAISGMVRSLGDPYTAFLDPKQNDAVKQELAGTYEGVGIQIGFDNDNRLVVIAPLSGTPAAGAGIRAKDLILKIDDKVTVDLTLPEAVDLIRGPAGSKVKLLLQRKGDGESFEKEIARAKINVKSVEVSYRQSLSANKQGKKGEIAVIKVSRFGETTDSEWDAAIGEVQNKDVAGIIVDMRNNPGGLLTSSIHLGSEFVNGTIVKQEFADGRVDSLKSDHAGRFLKGPLVVLVNDGSASASEIFAGAIKDNNRGEIVGEKTFGKGTVQDVVDLSGGASLHVTVAKWLTPKGKSIHKEGIEPDITVKLSDDDIKNDRDPQMEKALEII